MTNIILKLVALTVMSFLFSQVHAKDDVKSEAKKAVSASNRQVNKHAIGIGLGQTFLLGNFENKGDDKIVADLLYTYSASYSFDLLLGAHNSKHEYRGKSVYLRGYTMSIKGRSYEYDSFSPYLLGGLGFYMPEIKDSDGKMSEAKYTFGFNAGAGVDLRLNQKVIAGLMTHYHYPFEIKQDETENVRGSYFKLLLTLMYQF